LDAHSSTCGRRNVSCTAARVAAEATRVPAAAVATTADDATALFVGHASGARCHSRIHCAVSTVAESSRMQRILTEPHINKLEVATVMFARGFSSVLSRVRSTLTQRTLSSSAKTHSSSSLLATVAALGAAGVYAASDKSTAHASGDTLPLPECVCSQFFTSCCRLIFLSGTLLTTIVCSARTTPAAFVVASR
jgi:hypothetical protein